MIYELIKSETNSDNVIGIKLYSKDGGIYRYDNNKWICTIDSAYFEDNVRPISYYDYRKNLEHLRERYLNKISWLEKHINSDNQDNHMGFIDGLLTTIHDIEDILDGLDV